MNKQERQEQKRQERVNARMCNELEKLSEQANNDNIVNTLAHDLTKLYQEGQSNKEQFTNKLYTLAKILCHAKLNRLNSSENTWTSYTEELANMLCRTMFTDIDGETVYISEKYNVLEEELNNLYFVTYDCNGEEVIKCKDKEHAKDIQKAMSDMSQSLISLDNANELLQEAVAELWQYLTEHNDLFVLSQRLVNRSVYYRNGHTKPEYMHEYSLVNGVKKASLAISAKIEREKAITEKEGVFSCIEHKAHGTIVRQYVRQKGICAYDVECSEIASDMLEKLKFSKARCAIFKAIFLEENTVAEYAKKRNVSVAYVERELKAIRETIAKSGYFKELKLAKDMSIEKGQRKDNGVYSEKRVKVSDKNGYTLYTFESVGACAKALNIDKGAISKCINGKRKSANGYIITIALDK